MKQTTIKKKQWRREREDSDQVNIDGKIVKWKQFKNKFYEDIDAATSRGEPV